MAIERVRGKFKVTRIVRHRGSAPNASGEWVPCELQTVELAPVYDHYSPEDNTFAQATPAGKVELSITNPETVGFFELDTPYYVDLTRA